MSNRAAAIDALTEILHRRQRDGAKAVYLTPDARARLHAGLGDGTAEPTASALPVEVTPSLVAEAAPLVESSPVVEAPAVPQAPPVVEALPIVEPAIVAEAPASAVLEEVGLIAPASFQGASPAEQIADLARQAADFQPARSLGTLRDVPVFSTGNPSADLMLLGEAPSSEDEKQGIPFGGPAGVKLKQILKAMGIAHETVYISNICKFRPDMGPDQGFRSRKPTPEEMRSCMSFVLAEIQIVQPKLIVALGGAAAEGLLQIERASVGKMRGQFHDFNGLPVLITYHPSFLLRSENDPDGGMANKRVVWEDMLLVMEKLGLPISEKQQGFFKT